jgi:hypothetical protein
VTAAVAGPTLARRRRHRIVFAAAGTWNIAWGLRTVLDPGWLSRATGITAGAHPELLAGLGMVVGLYGLVYLEVARRPEEGWVPAMAGFLGKLLGAGAFAYFVARGVWPVSALWMTGPNDLVWLRPFGRYLVDAWPAFRRTLALPARPSRSTPETLEKTG